MSSSNNSAINSGSEGVIGIDEKKRRRMISNRESARRSRQKKQQHLDNLIKQVGSLKRENDEFDKKIGDISGVFTTVEAQNKVLRAEKDRLATRLESLESIIEIAKVVKGNSSNENGNGNGEFLYEVNEDDDPMMKPWKLPCRPSMPIMASSGLGCFGFEP